jgi:ketosteroid isomerase-like protein
VPVIEEYLAAVTGHQWDRLAQCVTDDVVRTGPFGDTYRGRDDYVAFIAGLMPRLPGYSMAVDRVAYSADGRVAIAQLSETVEVDGRPRRTPETLVFDLADDGRIAAIAIYTQHLDQPVPGLAR